ncbi:MAG: hypothetical protein ACJ8LN_15040, partial [Sulfurifustis sp.]
DEDVLRSWWGRSDWASLRGMTSTQRATVLCHRFREELGYRSALQWPIFKDANGGRVMYYMIHASDHEHAPNLMYRAYHKAVYDKETPQQFAIEFDEWKSAQ